jgi:hypothetical protein
MMHQTFPAWQILFITFTMSEPDRSGQCWNAYAALCMNTDSESTKQYLPCRKRYVPETFDAWWYERTLADSVAPYVRSGTKRLFNCLSSGRCGRIFGEANHHCSVSARIRDFQQREILDSQSGDYEGSTLVYIYQTTRRHIQEDSNLQFLTTFCRPDCICNLKSNLLFV